MTLIAGACGPEAAPRLIDLLPLEDAAAGQSAQLGPAAFGVAAGGGSTLWNDGAVLVAADARIDDRLGLAARLGLAGAPLSDAAIIARAWARWGEAAPNELIGDYAFALFDRRTETLWLVRDALGFRPLCFTAQDSAAAFCSLPSRLAGSAPTVSRLAFDRAAASRTTPLSWFAGVEQVQPGEMVALRGGAASRKFWWQPSTTPSFAGTREDLLVATRRALEQAVADRLGDDRRIACHLSAGLDSMAVTVTAADLLPAGSEILAITARPVPGCPVTSPAGRLIDEAPHAAKVAARYDTIHHVTVDAGGRSIADDLIDAARRFDQPLTNVANFGWFAASCDAAREGGAQRLLIAQLGNYALSATAHNFWWPLLRREGVSRSIAEWRRAATWRAPLEEMLRAWRANRGKPRAERRLAILRSFDPGLFLKGFEGQGLMVLDPTADRRLIELALTVPENLLVEDGDRRWVTRRILRSRVPDSVLDEPRRGFQAPDWLGRLCREAESLAAMLDRAGDLGQPGFDESAALLRTLGAGFDGRLDQLARTALATDLAVAGFRVATARNAPATHPTD